MERTLGDLAAYLGTQVRGDAAIRIRDVADLTTAGPGDISFYTGGRARKFLADTQASALIVPAEYAAEGRPFLPVPDPYAAFLRLVDLFRPSVPAVAPGIADSARVAPDATIDPSAGIGEYVVIGAGSAIGAGCVLMGHVYVGHDVVVGRDSILHPHVTVREHVSLGERVILQAGAVIGSDGFGYRRDGERHIAIPHRGRVVLEDDVEVGANCTIDRAVVGETRIAAGTKLDNLVHLAHNVQVGRHVVMAAPVGISGSTRIGDRVSIGGQAGLVEHLEVAADSMIGAQAGVTKSISTPGSAVWGYPAKALRDAKKIEVYLRRLPELFQRVEDLVKKVAGESSATDPPPTGKGR